MHGVITCHTHHLQYAKGIKQNIAKHSKGLQVATTPSCRYEQYRKIKVNRRWNPNIGAFCGHVFFFSKIPFGSIYCFWECHVFLPMPGFSILLSLQYLRCEKVAAWRSSQVGYCQTGVHLLICNLWSSEVVKRVRHNLPNQSKLLEGEHAKRFMKPLSSPGAWGLPKQSKFLFKLHICHLFFEFCHQKFLWHPFSSWMWFLMMEAIDVWHPIYAWLDINWKQVYV